MLKFEPSSKDRLFYDKYEYGVCISLYEAGCLRAKTAKALKEAISWRNTQRSSWSNHDMITGSTEANLYSMFDELELVRDKIKLIISFGVLYIYGNDTAVLEHLANLPYVKFCSAVQAVVDRPRDVVFKTDPKFAFRSYFRERMLDDEDRNRLLNFLDLQKDTFSITNTVKSQLNRNRHNWIQRWHFIEHNDPKDITMLSLVVPGLIRKTVPVKAK